MYRILLNNLDGTSSGENKSITNWSLTKISNCFFPLILALIYTLCSMYKSFKSLKYFGFCILFGPNLIYAKFQIEIIRNTEFILKNCA